MDQIHFFKLTQLHSYTCMLKCAVLNNLFIISNQKHHRCKKGQPRTKTGLAKKDVKSNGRLMPPGFDKLESFGHDKLTAKHCYFGCWPTDVDEIKIFDKDDQAAKYYFILMFCGLVIFVKNFDLINIRRL